MSKRTSIPEILARFWVVAFLISLPIGLPAVITGAISLGFLAFISFAVVAFYNALQWIGHFVLFGRTEEYKRFRESGGDPWFHYSCPPPFNCDSEQVRLTGTQEREGHWLCNNCFAQLFAPNAPCEACGFEQYECPRCATPVRDEFAMCPNCGHKPTGS